MSLDNLYVFIGIDYAHNPNSETHILESRPAIEFLKGKKIDLTINLKKGIWGMRDIRAKEWHFPDRNFGVSGHITAGPDWDTAYKVGVFDRTNLEGIKALAEFAMSVQCSRDNRYATICCD
jgi:hypothetical protein